MSKEKRRPRNPQGGSSFVELLLVTAVLLSVTAALLSVFQGGMMSGHSAHNATALQQHVRSGLSLVMRDLLFAGAEVTIGGIPVPTEFRPSGVLYPVTPDDGKGPIINGQVTDKVTIVYSPIATQTLDNDAATVYQISGPEGVATNGGQINLNTSGSNPTNATLKAGDVLLIKSNAQGVSALGYVTGLAGSNLVKFAAGDPLSLNKPGTTSPIAALNCQNQGGPSGCSDSAVAFKANILQYYLDDGSSLSAEDRPVLMRRKNGQSPTPVGLNVEDFQVQYTLEDGSTTGNPTNPVGIRKAQVRLVGRSKDKTQGEGGYIRLPVEAQTAVRNLAYAAKQN